MDSPWRRTGTGVPRGRAYQDIAGVELVRDRATKAAFDPVGAAGAIFQARAQANGLIVRALGDTVALCPPLIITEAQVDEVLRRFGQTIEETAKAVPA